MQKRIHRVLTCVRERTYAKIATMGGLCDVDLLITKATYHDDDALPERYVHELLKIFNVSPSTYSAFALSFARRFRKTHSWRVALKCLLLLHRLLRALPGHGPLRAELLWARSNGTLSLYPCNFRDSTSSSHNYTAFVRAYARLLHEALDCVVFDFHSPRSTNSDENAAEDLGRTIQVLPQLQSLIDRAIDCWPVGAASRSFLVHAVMKQVIRDSIWRYAAFTREIDKVLENLIQLPYRSCVAAFGIYKRAAAQAEELAGFHEWCKSMGYCGSYEYPLIDRIPPIQIRALESFLDGMWQLTDPEISRSRHEEVEAEVEPLIKREDDQETGWEELLEASIQRNEWQMEIYNPHGFQTPNPFHWQWQPNIINYYYGSCPNTPLRHPYATCA